MKNNKEKSKGSSSAKSKKSKQKNKKDKNIKDSSQKKTIEEIDNFIADLKYEKEPKRKQKKIKTKEKKHKKIIFTPRKIIALITILVFFFLLLFYVIVPTMQGSMHFLIVLSGSMNPDINPGDIVVSVYTNPEEIKTNDVITFTALDDPKNCITHRVVNITNENSSLFFQTKGDANDDPDLRLVKSSELIGKVVFVIPLLGYIPHFVSQPIGFLLIIIVPGVLIIINEIWSIIKIKKKEDKKKKN